jgi:hypothetical protein
VTTRASKSIDITDRPDVLRLVEEVRRTGEERALRRGDEVVAVLRPMAGGTAGSRARGRRARWARSLLAGYGAVRPRRRPEDFAAAREAFEAGVGEEEAANGTGGATS